MIFRNLSPSLPILTEPDWFLHAPPKGKIKHWVPGRSALETARLWLKGLPVPFVHIVHRFHLTSFTVAPEFVTKFDQYRGEGRNHDLFVRAQDAGGRVVAISIESKVDESFGPTVSERWVEIQNRLDKGENSNGHQRILGLFKQLLPGKTLAQVPNLRYQLLTGIAGALAEAVHQKTDQAVFLIQTFSQFANPIKHAQNQKDLDDFMGVFTDGKISNLEKDKLEGPIKMVWNGKLVNLWVGQYDIL
jgi:hypothetical protein